MTSRELCLLFFGENVKKLVQNTLYTIFHFEYLDTFSWKVGSSLTL